MNIKLVLSIAFLGTAAIYNLVGLNLLSLNNKNRVNRIFFVQMILLSLWAFFFSVMNFSKTPEYAVHWWRVSVVGWGLWYSSVAHLVDIVYRPKAKRGIIFYGLVYGLSLINVILYGFLGNRVQLALELKKTIFGWDTASILGKISPYFYIYYILVLLFIFHRIFNWSKHLYDQYLKTRIKIIAALFIVVSILAAVTDIYSAITGTMLPQVSVIMLLVPYSALIYVLKSRRLLTSDDLKESELLVNPKLAPKIYNLIGYSYIMGAYINFSFDHFAINHSVENSIKFSIFFLILGYAHFIVQRYIKSEHLYYIVITLSSIYVVLVSMLNFQVFGGNVIWAIVFYFMIITIVFDRVIYSYIFYGAMIAIQYYVGSTRENVYIKIDDLDNAAILLIILFIAVLIQYLSRIFRQRFQLNRRQLNHQRLLTEASSLLIDITKEEEYDYYDMILKNCCDVYEASRTYIIDLESDKLSGTIRHFKSKHNTHKDLKQGSYVDLTMFGNIKNLLNNREPIVVTDVDGLYSRSNAYLTPMKERGIKSFAVTPITINGIAAQSIVVVEYDYLLRSVDYIASFKMLGNLLGEAKKKIEYEDMLFKNASYDKTTGLINRSYFNEQLDEEILKAQLEVRKLAVIFIDIDNFKNINDAFGHNIGDEVLNKIGRILSNTMPVESMIARFGGDEFVIALKYVNQKNEVIKYLDYIINAFRRPLSIRKYEFRMSTSIGIAMYPTDGETSDELIKNADLAMYESKQQGKNRYNFCSENAKIHSMENIMYTNKLFNALANQEFMLVYQPQMSIKSKKMIGAEVLLRWKSPEFGIVPPNKFISILEHTGLIIDIGAWIISETLNFQEWLFKNGYPEFRMSVNLSAVQLQDEKMIDILSENLKKVSVRPEYFELEITETVAVNNPGSVLEKLKYIKALGCQIAIDDFGVEFSSLNRLQALPVDRLKIDKSFIDGIDIDEKKETIINIIIELARSLGLESIAEGVEYSNQLEFLTEHGCKEIQGYYYAKPLSKDDFIGFIEDECGVSIL